MSSPTRLNRLRDRGKDDPADLYALLDEVTFGILATVSDAMPWQVPLLFARDGDRILLHGSTGAGALRQADSGAPVSFAVTSLDGIVVADSTFESSANYRSAVIAGQAIRLSGEEQAEALDVLSNRLLPGRVGEVRPTKAKEWAATLVLSLPIQPGAWVMKARTGGPGEREGKNDAWMGVVPMRVVHGFPEPTEDSVHLPVPPSVQALLGNS